MKRKAGRTVSAILAVLTVLSLPLLLMLSTSGNGVPFTGTAAEYCDALIAEGFPEDYAVALTKLYLLHPNWSFVPLKITETNSYYTWDHVIKKETEFPTINLVSSNSIYKDYWHATNRVTYDSGYYQPSAATVKYVMDPRNFLNEADVFQFYNFSNPVTASVDAIDAVLVGSFMENAELQNGKTYTEYLIEIGEEIGIDPVYLAVKLRQEQGTSRTSPVILGNCGDTLWNFYNTQQQYTSNQKPIKPPASGERQSELLALNGLYNPFNVNATGDGVFAIYKNAMKYAQKGTASMSQAWGGSPAWDTDWKGVYGGALFIKEKYVDRYQSTVYLQKFDVDGRSTDGNFNNQYMQNVFGAVSEGRHFYRAFATNDILDANCQFLIPVYESMPMGVCADPANGDCPNFAPASERYVTTALITSPDRIKAHQNDAVYGDLTVMAGNALSLSGQFAHSYGIRRLEYSFDGINWTTCAESGVLELNITENLPPYGEHLLLIRGEAAYNSDDDTKQLNRYFLCAAFSLTMQPPPSVTLTLKAGNAVTEKKYYEGDSIVLPTTDDASFAGWVGSDGTLYPSGGRVILQSDVTYTALFPDFAHLDGAAVSTAEDSPNLRFYAVMADDDFFQLSPHGEVVAFLKRNSVQASETLDAAQSSVVGASGKHWKKFTVETPDLTPTEYTDLFEVQFALQITYTDGSTKIVFAQGDPSPRTLKQVAQSALADRDTAYSSQIIGYLQSLIS